MKKDHKRFKKNDKNQNNMKFYQNRWFLNNTSNNPLKNFIIRIFDDNQMNSKHCNIL